MTSPSAPGHDCANMTMSSYFSSGPRPGRPTTSSEYFARLDVQTFRARDRKKLLGQLRSLTCGRGVDRQAPATLRIEVVLLRKTKRAHQDQEIGFGIAS